MQDRLRQDSQRDTFRQQYENHTEDRNTWMVLKGDAGKERGLIGWWAQALKKESNIIQFVSLYALDNLSFWFV